MEDILVDGLEKVERKSRERRVRLVHPSKENPTDYTTSSKGEKTASKHRKHQKTPRQIDPERTLREVDAVAVHGWTGGWRRPRRCARAWSVMEATGSSMAQILQSGTCFRRFRLRTPGEPTCLTFSRTPGRRRRGLDRLGWTPSIPHHVLLSVLLFQDH